MRISIVTACYNSASTIGDTIRSLQSQSYKDIEHIIVDGGSTDGTMDLVSSLRTPTDVIISERDSGVYDALNKGLRSVTGEVVGFLHSDDVYKDDSVLEKVEAAFRTQKCEFLYANLDYVDLNGRIRRSWRSGRFCRAKLRSGWMPPHPTTFMRTSLARRIGDFDLRYKIAADYDYLLRVLKAKGLRIFYLDQSIVTMRLGGISNRDLKSIIRKSKEDLSVLKRNGIGGLLSLFLKNLQKIGQLRAGNWRTGKL
jgi:glycosyltransferase